MQTGGALQCKWDVCCGVSLSSSLSSQEGTVIQMGGLLQHTNWRCTAVTFRRVVQVGGSWTFQALLKG